MTGWIPLIATRIQDSLGNLLSSGTLLVQPTDNKNVPISAAAGGIGGALSMAGAQIPILNGALVTSAAVPDTSQTSPANICLRLTVLDSNGNKIFVLPLIQTGGLQSLNLDHPVLAINPLLPLFTRGPVGPMGSPGSFGPTVKTATQIGCTADGTDCGPMITSFLASASAQAPHVLVLDCPGLISISGIALPPNGYCSIFGFCEEAGFFLLNGSYQDAIYIGYNANTDPGAPAPAPTASNITLANFRIDGNRAGQHGNASASNGQPGNTGPYRWTFGINLVSCTDVRIQNVTVVHASTYSIRLSNVQRALIDGCRLLPFLDSEAVSPTNTDGIHINGPFSAIKIANCYFRTGDDAIALNLPEGYSGNGSLVGVSNCVFNGCQTFMRIYAAHTAAQGQANQITADGLTGSANVAAFVFGLEALASNPQDKVDWIRNVKLSNINFSGPRFAIVSCDLGDVEFDGCRWSEAQQGVGFLQAWVGSQTWANISIKNCSVLRDSLGNSQVSVVDTTTMTDGTTSIAIQHLTISNFDVQDMGTGTAQHDYAQIPVLNLSPRTTISQLLTSGLATKFANLVSINGVAATSAQYKAVFSGQNVTSTDLLHMAPVPDSICYLGTMYWSLDQGNAFSIVNWNSASSTPALTPSTITTTSH